MESGGSKSSNEPAVLYFDEDGDTRLSLTRCDPERTYVVSSKAMSLVCSAWKSMLSRNNGFKEGTLVESNCAIPLPDDDPEALELLLNIAHMRFERIPKTLTFDDLLAVADLTEKYGAVKILRPWLKDWLKDIEHLVKEPGYEEWLFIAWAFGEEEIFTRLSNRLVREVHLVKDGEEYYFHRELLRTSSNIGFVQSMKCLGVATPTWASS
ncbi:Nuclear pore protein [Lasiodiplodia theobromae]|uniref:Nuclear pore protein n=1 Tax=Lasiodiplodia theobromae TaxID=45133 RepID=UPI0015C3DABF|nr:Nuclear pore protein [Lasiodiplodia theobromae]KAF4534771.1 Nuclear pore protein [Lasiodiplodia theobromae]